MRPPPVCPPTLDFRRIDAEFGQERDKIRYYVALAFVQLASCQQRVRRTNSLFHGMHVLYGMQEFARQQAGASFSPLGRREPDPLRRPSFDHGLRESDRTSIDRGRRHLHRSPLRRLFDSAPVRDGPCSSVFRKLARHALDLKVRGNINPAPRPPAAERVCRPCPA